jgi:hypothetical protein
MASTALGGFTLVLSSVTSLGADPEIGSIYLPKGPLDATLVRRLTRAGYANHRRER